MRREIGSSMPTGVRIDYKALRQINPEAARLAVLECLASCGHNVAAAARAFGITRPVVYASIRKQQEGDLADRFKASYRRPRQTPSLAMRRRCPSDLVVDRPGALVQLDTKYVPLSNGVIVYQFGAVDYFTRKRVVALAPQLASAAGRHFLEQLVAPFDFPVQAAQTDNGPEFLGEFTVGARRLGLTRYYNCPYYPQGNGRIERSFETDEEEFY